MGDKDKQIFQLWKGIKKDIKDVDNYHSGLINEGLIVAAYKQMSISDLEKLRFVLNKIIAKKKIFRRVNASTIRTMADNDRGDIPPAK